MQTISSSLLFQIERRHENLSKTTWIYIADTARYGIGIFAAKRFIKEQVILRDDTGCYFEGAISYEQVRTAGLDLSRHCFQVDSDLFLLPSGSIDDLINHSCEPNTGIRLTRVGYDLVALRDIAPDEQLTYDYSTYIDSPERLLCSCGVARCRGEIGRFRELPANRRAYYLAHGVVGAFAASSVAVNDRLPARTTSKTRRAG